MRTALTIAGADPSGGAGIQSDIKTFEALGVMGLSAITSLTAQNRSYVKATRTVPSDFLKAQVTTLLEEFRIHAVKIGMLGSSANAIAAGELIREYKLKNVVLDTVLRSTGGHPLIDKKGVGAIRALLPFTTIVTPNLPEASIISGIEIKNEIQMEAAAKEIFSMGAPFVLVKGGHLKGAPLDILFDGKRFEYYECKRIRGKKERFHGTGCILSAAIAAGLANRKPLKTAILEAKSYLNKTLSERA